MFKHNGDDLVSQGYGTKREVPRKQSRMSEAAQCRAVPQTLQKKTCGSTMVLCAQIFIRGHDKVDEISDWTVPSECRIDRNCPNTSLKTRHCDKSSVA